MKTLRSLLLFLFLVSAYALQASDVKFRSGSTYQLRCVLWPTGCVAPSSDNPEALTYTFTPSDDIWWRITLQEDGTFLIQNEKSKRFFTYDGRRSTLLRYSSLCLLNAGAASSWTLDAAQEGFVVRNVMQTSHVMNIRYRSMIVGTYKEMAEWPSENERFFLVDKKGRVVQLINDRRVNISEECFSSDDMALPLSPKSSVSDRKDPLHEISFFDNNTHQFIYIQGGNVPSPVPDPEMKTGRNRERSSQGNTLMLTVNGTKPARDTRSQTWLATVPSKALKGTFRARLASENGEKNVVFCIDGKRQKSKGNCEFEHPEGGRLFRVAMTGQGGDTLAAAWLCFTTLPIVEIEGPQLNANSFSRGSFVLHDPDHPQKAETWAAGLRFRGEWTLMYPKHNFGIKLLGKDGKKENRQMLDLRTDNYWILDAMANDPGRIRNRLCQDLWLDMKTPVYYAKKAPEARNGVRGRRVEVFFNGRYEGVYDLSEHIDRKQLQLAKGGKGEAYGRLYKGELWTQEVLMMPNGNMSRPAAGSSSWAGWEMRYPKSEKKRADADCWKPLYDGVKLVRTASDAEFASHVREHFDFDAVVDYMLLLDVTFPVDNTGKNLYWAVYDVRQSPCLTPVPWDLDASFGIKWDGSRFSDQLASSGFWEYMSHNNGKGGLFSRLPQVCQREFREQISKRYRKLRSTVFSTESLLNRIDAYYAELQQSGADTRECRRWNHTGCARFDATAERAELKKWITNRMRYLDRIFGNREG